MVRPTFKPTTAMRRQVSIAAGAGLSHEEIARGLGIARNTLAKHFDAELSVGAYQRRMEALTAMHKAAKGGNVAAQKAFMQLGMASVVRPAPVPAIGKKAKAQADAETAEQGTGWEMLLPSPRLTQ